jgi:hypothetical protein
MLSKKLAAAVVLGTLALAPTAQPSQAADPSGSSSAGTAHRVQVRPLIQGLVADPQGHYLDGVEVEAVRANGNIAATNETYASVREDGPQHGYFYLEIGGKGDFSLRLSKAGYVTRTYPVGEVGPKQVVSIGAITLTKAAADTTTKAGLQDASISTVQKAKVEVTVSTKATKKPTGDIEIRNGNKVVGTGTLTSGDKGTATLTLRKLEQGTYHLKAYFLGTKTLKKSNSGAETLTVKKPRHRPNAW